MGLRIYYGGTFDPVHLGHLAIARAARDQLQVAVRLLPAADPLTYLATPGEGPLSLQTMCRGGVTWQQLEELERAGAQGLMVLSVERSLA